MGLGVEEGDWVNEVRRGGQRRLDDVKSAWVVVVSWQVEGGGRLDWAALHCNCRWEGKNWKGVVCRPAGHA